MFGVRFSGGFIGVDVFFVISGFVITGLLLRESTDTGRVGLLGFYARRARRILPVALFVIVVTLIVEQALFGGPTVGPIAGDARMASGFVADFAPPTTLFHPMPRPLDTYWSLAVEEQFYLVYPALFLVVLTLGRRWSLRTKLGFALSIVITSSFIWSVVSSSASASAYTSPLTRAWELAAGALLATLAGSLRRLPVWIATGMTWTGLCALLLLGKNLFLPIDYPGWKAALPVIGASLVIAGGTSAPRYGAEALLKLTPFKWLGRWSYSLYLWHWPILVIAGQRWGQLTGIETLLLGVGAVILSAGTYFLLENPIRHSAFLNHSPAATVFLGLALIVVCFAITFAF